MRRSEHEKGNVLGVITGFINEIPWGIYPNEIKHRLIQELDNPKNPSSAIYQHREGLTRYSNMLEWETIRDSLLHAYRGNNTFNGKRFNSYGYKISGTIQSKANIYSSENGKYSPKKAFARIFFEADMIVDEAVEARILTQLSSYCLIRAAYSDPEAIIKTIKEVDAITKKDILPPRFRRLQRLKLLDSTNHITQLSKDAYAYMIEHREDLAAGEERVPFYKIKQKPVST